MLLNVCGVMRPIRRFVYILRSEKQPARYYSGLTCSVASRVEIHNSGGSQHTARDRPWRVVASIEFADEGSAVAFEKY